MVSAPPKPNDPTGDRHGPNIPPTRGYSQRGGRPGLNVDFMAVCDAVQGAKQGNGETVTDVAARFGVSGVGFGNGCTRLSKVGRRRLNPVDMQLPSLSVRQPCKG